MLISSLSAIIFDFDGVLTDNRVYLNQEGQEWTCCHRGDGLAFDVMRKLGIKVFILSTETNPVVTARARKLRVRVQQGVPNKVDALKQLSSNEPFDLAQTLYVGNDLNDYYAMQQCGFSACPADSHPKIKEIATYTLKTSGGFGVARELIEEILHINILEVLYASSYAP